MIKVSAYKPEDQKNADLLQQFFDTPAGKKLVHQVVCEEVWPQGCFICGQPWEEHRFYVRPRTPKCPPVPEVSKQDLHGFVTTKKLSPLERVLTDIEADLEERKR